MKIKLKRKGTRERKGTDIFVVARTWLAGPSIRGIGHTAHRMWTFLKGFFDLEWNEVIQELLLN